MCIPILKTESMYIRKYSTTKIKKLKPVGFTITKLIFKKKFELISKKKFDVEFITENINKKYMCIPILKMESMYIRKYSTTKIKKIKTSRFYYHQINI